MGSLVLVSFIYIYMLETVKKNLLCGSAVLYVHNTYATPLPVFSFSIIRPLHF